MKRGRDIRVFQKSSRRHSQFCMAFQNSAILASKGGWTLSPLPWSGADLFHHGGVHNTMLCNLCDKVVKGEMAFAGQASPCDACPWHLAPVKRRDHMQVWQPPSPADTWVRKSPGQVPDLRPAGDSLGQVRQAWSKLVLLLFQVTKFWGRV